MKKIGQFLSYSPQQTQEIAQQFLQKIKPGEVIGLKGELGTGKTVFVKGLARGLAVKERVVSPSFVILKIYPGKLNGQKIELCHLDFYRLENPNLAEFAEFLGRKDRISVVEWPEHQKKLKLDWLVKFAHAEENTRKIEIFKVQDEGKNN